MNLIYSWKAKADCKTQFELLGSKPLPRKTQCPQCPWQSPAGIEDCSARASHISKPHTGITAQRNRELPNQPQNTPSFLQNGFFSFYACKACEMAVSDFSRNRKSRSSRPIPSLLAYPRATRCFMKECLGQGPLL